MKTVNALAFFFCTISSVLSFAMDASIFRVGERVIYARLDGETLSAIPGTVTKFYQGNGWFNPSAEMRSDAGITIKIPADQFPRIWRAAGCDTNQICVGTETYLVSVDGFYFGVPVQAKLIGIDDKARDSGVLFLAQAIAPSGRFKAGDIVSGYPAQTIATGACLDNRDCVGNELLVSRDGRQLNAQVVGLFGEFRCSGATPSRGVIVRYSGGDLALLGANCDLFVNLSKASSCEGSGTCPGQYVYYPARNGPRRGLVEASDSVTAFVHVGGPSRHVEAFLWTKLGHTFGCLEKESFCIGEKVLHPRTKEPLEIKGFFRSSRELIIQYGQTTSALKSSVVYRMVGCDTGLCVGSEIRMKASGERAKIIGRSDTGKFAVNFLSGEHIGEIGFDWSAADFLRP